MSILTDLRLAGRGAGFLACTAGTLAGLELSSLGADSAGKAAALARWSSRWARVVVPLCGLELVRVGALEAVQRYPGQGANGRGRVFIANHRSILDVLLAMAVAEITFMSRHDVARWPCIGLAARRAGTVFVDRRDKASGQDAITAAVTLLESGRGVIIFPEGTTFSGDEVRPFRYGAVRAAERAGAEVVPLGIAYEDDTVAFGDESFAAHLRRVGGQRRVRVAVAGGAPLELRGLPLEQANAKACARVQELVVEARGKFTGEKSVRVERRARG